MINTQFTVVFTSTGRRMIGEGVLHVPTIVLKVSFLIYINYKWN